VTRREQIKILWASRPVRKLRRDRLALFCLAVIGVYLVIALAAAAGLLGATGFEDRVGDKFMGPSTNSWKTWLGTDRQGRSILLRTLFSAKIAIKVGFVSAALGVFIGTVIGGIAGYFGRRVDDLVVWLYSTVQSIPSLLLLMLIASIWEGLTGIYIAFGATFWIGPCRVVRGEVMKLRETEYVQSAHAMGYGRWRVLLRHILPNTMHLALVNFALLFVGAIKSEVILSYLGLGVVGEPSWGIMINQAKTELVNGFFWQIGTATASMFGLVLCFNVFSDALQDALDPKAL